MLAIGLVAMLASADPDLVVTNEGAYGPFTVEREVYERTGTPSIHRPNYWKKARLIWRSNNGAVQAVWEDDGWALQVGYKVVRLPEGDFSCSVGNTLGRYGEATGNAEAWVKGVADFEGALRSCPSLSRNEIATYAAEYRTAASRFPDASQRLRVIASSIFPTLTRCIKTRVTQYDQGPITECRKKVGPKT